MANQQDIRQTQSIFQNQLLRNGLVFSACLLLITSGYLFWKQSKPQTEDTVLQKPKTKTQMIFTQQAVFKTKTAPYLNKTFIKVAFRFPKQESSIWLDMDVTKGAQPLKLLVYHPLFNNLKWPEISNAAYTLYQKKKKYQSVDEFLKKPPTNATIAADDVILKNINFTENKTISLETISDLSTVDYILTTFHPLFTENGYRIYETTVDASRGSIINHELAWMLYSPDISKNNPLDLGGIDITYNQPKVN